VNEKYAEIHKNQKTMLNTKLNLTHLACKTKPR